MVEEETTNKMKTIELQLHEDLLYTYRLEKEIHTQIMKIL